MKAVKVTAVSGQEFFYHNPIQPVEESTQIVIVEDSEKVMKIPLLKVRTETGDALLVLENLITWSVVEVPQKDMRIPVEVHDADGRVIQNHSITVDPETGAITGNVPAQQ